MFFFTNVNIQEKFGVLSHNFDVRKINLGLNFRFYVKHHEFGKVHYFFEKDRIIN